MARLIELIGSIFLTRRRYMTIPQAILRRALDADEVDEYLADISFGSTGGLHKSRDRKGNEVDKKIPDFLVVKVFPTPPHLPRAYTMVCLVEVKRDDLTTPQADDQMTGYMHRALEQGSFSEDFRGYLVMGKEVLVYGYRVTDHGSLGVAAIGRFSMLDGGDFFTRELSQISVNNWNEE